MSTWPFSLRIHYASVHLAAHGLDRLEHHGIALQFHFVALLDAESLVEELRLEAVGDELALGEPFGEARTYLAFVDEGAELVEDLRCDLEIGRDLVGVQILS